MRADGDGGAPDELTDLETIPWGDPPEPAIATSTPRKCKHPPDRRTRREDGGWTCVCGHSVAGAKVRGGRAVRKYGKAAELAAARRLGLEPRGTSRDPEDAGGALDPVVLQAKTGPGFAAVAWIRELEALERVAVNRPRILLALEKPGHGKRQRRLVVMFEDEFVRLTGLDARRRNLERYVEAVAARRRMGVVHLSDYSAVQQMTRLETEIDAAWDALEQTPAR